MGGGPAGLECARVAARRGHAVRLVERSDRLGGVAAVAGPGRPLVDWLEGACRSAGVTVSLGVTAEPADLEGLDVVVLATGSRRGLRTFEVEEGAVVLDVLDVGRRRQGRSEGSVAVWDPIGGPIGVALAERLGDRATLITPDAIAGNELSRTGDLAPANVRLQQAGVRIERRTLLRSARARRGRGGAPLLRPAHHAPGRRGGRLRLPPSRGLALRGDRRCAPPSRRCRRSPHPPRGCARRSPGGLGHRRPRVGAAVRPARAPRRRDGPPRAGTRPAPRDRRRAGLRTRPAGSTVDLVEHARQRHHDGRAGPVHHLDGLVGLHREAGGGEAVLGQREHRDLPRLDGAEARRHGRQRGRLGRGRDRGRCRGRRVAAVVGGTVGGAGCAAATASPAPGSRPEPCTITSDGAVQLAAATARAEIAPHRHHRIALQARTPGRACRRCASPLGRFGSHPLRRARWVTPERHAVGGDGTGVGRRS